MATGAATRFWLAVGAAGLALVLGIAAALWWRAPAGAGQDAGPLLAIALPDTEGRSQPLAQWKGKLLVVNFWATWCAPCREEMPMFVKAQAEHGPRGLQFVGIAVDDAAKVKQFAAEIGLNYPALVGGYGAMELSRTLGNQVMALPFTVIVDPQGKVALTHLGPLKAEQLDRVIEKSL
jgi:thiol-disulfide isomerase/thioredoxin